MTVISNHHAILALKEIAEDDDIALEHPHLVGGIFVTSLQSKREGSAGLLLAKLIAAYGHKIIALHAFAASGDHERLKNLYRRFGFIGDGYFMQRKP